MYIPYKTPRDRARIVNCYHGLKGFLVWVIWSIPTDMRPGSPSTLVSEFTIPTPIQMKKIYIRVYLLSGTKVIVKYGVIKISSYKTCNIEFFANDGCNWSLLIKKNEFFLTIKWVECVGKLLFKVCI